VSLPAIARLLDLEDENRMLRGRIAQLETALRAERENRPGVRVFAAGSTGVVPMPSGRRIRRSTEVMLWNPRGGA
jgi:MerR family transcriptional regulator/heat shock protein HspR